MRDAIGLLDQLSVFSQQDRPVDEARVLEILGLVPVNELNALVEAILKREPGTLFDTQNRLLAIGKEPIAIINELSEHFLTLLENLSKDEAPEKFQHLIEVCKDLDVENSEIVQIIDSLNSLNYALRNTTQVKNVLRAWLLKICYRADILVVKDLLSRIEILEAQSMRSAPGSRPQAPVERKQEALRTQPMAKPETTVSVTPKPELISRPQPSTASAVEGLESFLQHLSPGSKGMYISSQARLIKIEGTVAQMQMPEKFKFLKSKLESRSTEILDAINKSSGGEVRTINIEVVEVVDQAASNP
jgi:DNA polymerase III gamma/tau subunit